MATTDPTPNPPIRRKRVADDENKYITPSCPPGWAWLLAGIMIGIFISFLVYLREIAPHSLPSGGNTANAPYVNDNMQAANSGGSKPSTDFKFYDVLPNTGGGKSGGTPKPSTDAAAPTEPTETETSPSEAEVDQPVTTAGRYLLRVVSYRDERMAEGLKGHLATLGITAQVEATPLTADGRWYRVQVGPFTDLDKLNKTRALLKKNSLDFELVKF
jgi:hypothetical protein